VGVNIGVLAQLSVTAHGMLVILLLFLKLLLYYYHIIIIIIIIRNASVVSKNATTTAIHYIAADHNEIVCFLYIPKSALGQPFRSL